MMQIHANSFLLLFSKTLEFHMFISIFTRIRVFTIFCLFNVYCIMRGDTKGNEINLLGNTGSTIHPYNRITLLAD
jgi:hypothetical protein